MAGGLRPPHISVMKRYALIAAAVIFVAVIFAAIVPLWTMMASVSLPPVGLGLVVLMVIGCFGVGGGLMFLVFYSSRNGYDDAVHNGRGWRNPDEG